MFTLKPNSLSHVLDFIIRVEYFFNIIYILDPLFITVSITAIFAVFVFRFLSLGIIFILEFTFSGSFFCLRGLSLLSLILLGSVAEVDHLSVFDVINFFLVVEVDNFIRFRLKTKAMLRFTFNN